MPSFLLGSLFGLTTSQALVVLFVLLPLVLAAVIVPLASWRWSKGPKPVLTSEILATGEAGRAKIVSMKNLGGVLDMRPMVRFTLQVKARDSGEPFDLVVVQSLPRALVGDYHPGDVVDVRFTADRLAGAVVLGSSYET